MSAPQPNRAGWREEAGPVIALLLVWALFFWRLAAPTPGDRLTYAPGDFTETFALFRDLAYRAFVAGQMPLWVECLWSGYPLFADPQAQLYYPLKWLTFAGLRLLGYGHFPLEALVLETAAHYLLISYLTYRFLRVRALRPSAATLGAVTFAYGGYLTGYPPLQTAVLNTNLWLPLALLGVEQVARTGRWTQVAWVALALTGAYSAGHPQTFLFVSLITAAYLVFRLWPAAITRPELFRLAGGVAGLIGLTAALSAAALVPAVDFIRHTTRASVSFAEAAHGFPFQDVLTLLVPNLLSYWNPLYVGLLPLTLAAFALGAGRRAEVRFWAGLAAAALALGFGTAGVAYDGAYWLIPGLGLFRGAERFALIVSFALAMLAAIGADHLLYSLTRAERRTANRLAWALTGLLVAGLGVAWAGARAPAPWSQLAPSGGQTAWLAGLALAVWLVRARAPWLRPAWPALLVAAAAVDLLIVNRPLNFRPLYNPYPPDALVAQVVAEAGFVRVQDDARLPGHAGCGYGFREIEGVTPYHLAAYEQVLQRPEPERWRLLGVGYVVTWRAELFDPAGQRIPSEVVLESETVDEKGNPTRLHRLSQTPQRAWLTAPELAALSAEAAPGAVRVTTEAPGQIELEVDAPTEAVVVVSEAYFPGWQVEVDHVPTPPTPAVGGALLGVHVPAGTHAIRFSFQPASLGWGAAISAIAFLTALALLVWPARR